MQATFSGAIVAGRTRPGERQTITTKEVDDKPQEGAEVYNIHAYARSEGICGIIVSDLEYPERVAHAILSKILDGFASKYPRTAYANAQETTTLPYPELDELIKKYQNPEEADSVMKIQKELDETKNIMHKTLESVLERGEKMENLVQKSELLSSQSKMFYTQVRPASMPPQPLYMLTVHLGQEAELLL